MLRSLVLVKVAIVQREKGSVLTRGPDVQRIKQEKRDRLPEPGAAGMTRRHSLTFLGVGSAALTAGSAGILTSCGAEGQQGAAAQGQAASGDASFSKPIEASDADDIILPEGFSYSVVRKWGDDVARARPTATTMASSPTFR